MHPRRISPVVLMGLALGVAIAQDSAPTTRTLALNEDAYGVYHMLVKQPLEERGVVSRYEDGELHVEGSKQGTAAAVAMAGAITADADETVRYGDVVLWVLGPRRDLPAVEVALTAFGEHGGRGTARAHFVRRDGPNADRLYLRGDRESMDTTRGLLNACTAYHAKRVQPE